MTSSLGRLAELVQRESGVTLEETHHSALLAALARAWPDADPSSFLELAGDPRTSSHAVARLIDEVTIKETSFLRDRVQLHSIDWHALRALADAQGSESIRIWSAGCATGEEPYSLALLACEAFAPDEPRVEILGTDISGAALAAAEAGRYGDRSLATVDESLRSRYFTRDQAGYTISERLRTLVDFAPHNLVGDPFPPLGQLPFHLIVCRNVFIYFIGETVDSLVVDFAGSLARGGRLLLGAADVLCGSSRRAAQVLVKADTSSSAHTAIRVLRAPLGREPQRTFAERHAEMMSAADEGRADDALRVAAQLIEEDALNPDVYFARGLVELESGNAAASVRSLRRALYLDPDFGLAAFKLGRAYEVLGDLPAARRSYQQALGLLQATPHRRDDQILAQIDVVDVAAACAARLAAIAVHRAA